MFRSLGMRFDGKVGFAMLPAAMGARFNVQKTPAVLLMFPVPAKEGEGEPGQILQRS